MSYRVSASALPVIGEAVRVPSLENGDGNTPRRHKSVKSPQNKSIAAERVLRSFNTRAFKREQPDRPDLMLQIISEAIACDEPVSFVLYWGKGPRHDVGEPETKTLDYLAALGRRVREAHAPGAAITLICTDTHAQLNGYSQQDIRAYFDDVAIAAQQRGFESCWLGGLMRAVDAAPEEDLRHQEVPKEILPTLCASAMKWFKGDGTAEQGAIRYYQLNMIEKRVVELAFPRSIFVTFNGSELRVLFPSRLPIFYMFSLRHGVSDKPWFLPSRDAPSSANAPHLAPST
jgi:L-tyrosine isonitrile synthase